MATRAAEHPASPDEVENAADDQQPPGETAPRVIHGHFRKHHHRISPRLRPPISSLRLPSSCCTPVLLSVPVAAPDHHLPSTVRPQCGDGVKLARKCEGGTEGEPAALRGAFGSGGGSRCAASGGVGR